MIRKLRSLHKDEAGQSFVELALILPILILLLTLPIDYFRYINTKMTLCSAACDGVGQVTFASVSSGTAVSDIVSTMNQNYGDRLDTGKIVVTYGTKSPEEKDYTYYVYSSALADEDPDKYWDQFEERPSNYHVEDIEVQMACTIKPITFWGALFIDGDINVQTPVYSRSVYASGYTP